MLNIINKRFTNLSYVLSIDEVNIPLKVLHDSWLTRMKSLHSPDDAITI